MDTQLKINPRSKSTSNIINDIHRMPWLKKRSLSQNAKVHRVAAGIDGQIMSTKKTDEDYFAGTREEKKAKKRKEKKGKPVLTLDELEDLVSQAQKQTNHENESISVVPGDSPNEETISFNEPKNINVQDTEIVSQIHNDINTKTNDDSVWSATSAGTAEKLFPNVQSVRIDRFEEEEMLSRAIAESIATLQLEQFKKNAPEKGQRWEALYGDNVDDGGWDNVRRNLPPALQNTNPRLDSLDQSKVFDDNNNSNSLNRSGILRNRETTTNRFTLEIEDSDFCFKTCPESSIEDTKTDGSQKSVSFNESIDVKIRSSESSENDESLKCLNNNEIEGGPKIDKFGRVDGYSERRLFMGKGARMKEQEYILNQCSLGGGDARNENLNANLQATTIMVIPKPLSTISQTLSSQKSAPNLENRGAGTTTSVKYCDKTPETRHPKIESNSETMEICDTNESALTTVQFPEDVHSPKTIAHLKEEPKIEKTISVKSSNKTTETKYKKFQSNSKTTEIIKPRKRELKTSQHPSENSQTQKSMQNFTNPEIEKTIVLKHLHGRPRIQKDIEQNGDSVEKLSDSLTKSDTKKPSSKSLGLDRDSAINGPEKSCTEYTSSVKLEPQLSEKAKWKPIKNDTQIFRGKENIESRPLVAFNISNGLKTREKQIRNCKKDFIKSGVQKIDSVHKHSENRTRGLEKFNGPSKKNVITEKKSSKDLQAESENQDTISKNFADFLKIDKNICEEQIPKTKTEKEPEGRCLVSTLIRDDECAANSSTENPEYLNYAVRMSDERCLSAAQQNLLLAGIFCSDSSYSIDSQHLQSQSLDHNKETQSEFMRDGKQIYENTLINQSTNMNTSPYSRPPNYGNEADKQMDRTKFAYFMDRFSAQNPHYHSHSVNPGNSAVSNFTEDRENLASGQSIRDSVPMTEMNRATSHESAQNYVEPYVILKVGHNSMRNVQLPPGFTRKKPTPRFNVDENKSVMNSSAVKRNIENIGLKEGSFNEQKSLLRPTHNWRQTSAGELNCERSWRPNLAQMGPNSVKAQENCSVSQTVFEHEDRRPIGNRKVPYPILGAAPNSHGKYRYYENDEPESGLNPEYRRDAVSDQSLDPNNNNYLIQSTPDTISELADQGIDESLLNCGIAYSRVPVIGRISDARYSGSSNWQYNVNLMNLSQVAENSMHNYEIPMSNYDSPHQSSPVNITPGYFKLPMYQNAGFQQFPMNMLRSVQIPVGPIPFPRSLDAEGNGSENLSPQNVGSLQMDSGVDNHDPSIEMLLAAGILRSSTGAHFYPNDNPSQVPMTQFVSNPNFYETECNMVPMNMRDPQIVHENQTEDT